MSVTLSPTFQPETDVLGYMVRCYCGQVRVGAAVGTYGEAVALCRANDGLSCEECYDEVRPDAIDAGHPGVNMANDNARVVFDLLGLPLGGEDWSGEVAADDLLGRALLALAVAPADEGMPAYEVAPAGADGQRGARMVDCGRSEGYSQDRLVQIAQVARWASQMGRTVTWA